MSPSVHDLRPDSRERGLASWPQEDVAALLSAAWDGLLDVARAADLAAGTRVPDRSVRDLLVHLGRWSDDRDELEALELEARTRQVTSLDDSEAALIAKLAAHEDASRTEILTALDAARDHVLRFVTTDGASVGRRYVHSALGPLPLTGLLAAQTVDLAVHALDIAAGTSLTVPDPLLHAALGAVADVVGALTARSAMSATFGLVTPRACWATGSDDEGSWTTIRLDLDVRHPATRWPALIGEAGDILDAVTGRALLVQLVATRRIRLQRVTGLIRLLPALHVVPGIPGGSALQASRGALTQAGSLVARASTGATRGVVTTLRRR